MNSNFSQFKLLEGQVIDGKHGLIKVQDCLKPDRRQRWIAKQALDAVVAIKRLALSTPTVQP